ncbi:MAG: hypothetical protein IJ742_02475, partial [Prevotella sp.]|nr:hypothetical protein [Prevotella sp.]
MIRKLCFILFAGLAVPLSAQGLRVGDGTSGMRLLSLDSCRAMALRNNKQIAVSKVKQDVAANIRKAARTKYLPHVSA